ncbi:hypothetical protein FWF89_00570 [Candidatus Saccharibacteria bacterium]|nr:hypothetical protein [Candidatus Saccharibacteria bacterium]
MDTRAFSFLVREWVKTLDSKAVCDYRKPVVGNLTELLVKAFGQNRTLTFVGASCQPWMKVSTIPEVDAIPLIDPTRKRPRRFAAEVASFFRALESFGINYRFMYTVSDIEVRVHAELGNMGLQIANIDAMENARANQDMLVGMLLEAGVNVQRFSELDALTQYLRPNSLEHLQWLMAGRDPTYAQFLSSLYELEFTTVLPAIAEDELAIWLDVQTFAYRDLVEDFEMKAREFAPDVPLVSVIKNCGNWNYGSIEQNTFLSKNELLAKLCGFDIRDKHQVPVTTDEWKNKLMHLNSSRLSDIWYAASNMRILPDCYDTARWMVSQIVDAFALQAP